MAGEQAGKDESNERVGERLSEHVQPHNTGTANVYEEDDRVTAHIVLMREFREQVDQRQAAVLKELAEEDKSLPRDARTRIALQAGTIVGLIGVGIGLAWGLTKLFS